MFEERVAKLRKSVEALSKLLEVLDSLDELVYSKESEIKQFIKQAVDLCEEGSKLVDEARLSYTALHIEQLGLLGKIRELWEKYNELQEAIKAQIARATEYRNSLKRRLEREERKAKE